MQTAHHQSEDDDEEEDEEDVFLVYENIKKIIIIIIMHVRVAETIKERVRQKEREEGRGASDEQNMDESQRAPK